MLLLMSRHQVCAPFRLSQELFLMYLTAKTQIAMKEDDSSKKMLDHHFGVSIDVRDPVFDSARLPCLRPFACRLDSREGLGSACAVSRAAASISPLDVSQRKFSSASGRCSSCDVRNGFALSSAC